MDLLTFLKKNKDSRKVFGKRELRIIEKQLMGMKLSQSEKNRLSRDIRKKLDFIKEINRFSKEFSLKKGSIIKALIAEALEEILDHKWHNKIKQVMLFGSHVSGEANLSSDIDIAVEFDSITRKDATRYRLNVYRNVDDLVDVQVLNVLPEKVKKSIEKNKRILYERKKRPN